MQRVMISLERELYEQLRKEAYETHTSMVKIIVELVKNKYQKGGKKL